MKIICFDIGGTKISKALVAVEMDTGTFNFLDYQTENNPIDAQKIEKSLMDYVQLQKSETSKIGVSSACVVDPKKLTVHGAKRIYGMDIFSFAFLKQPGYEITLENDGRCFALGEYFFSGQKPVIQLSITLGTGMGGGLVINGANYQGAHYSAMEMSHRIIEKDGARCLCGRQGCWQSLAGGSGIEATYKSLSGKNLETKKIFDLYAGDEIAKQVLDQANDYLAFGMVSLLNLLDPEAVVIGGSISHRVEYVNQAIEKAKKQAYNQQADYQFRISDLKDKSNLLGAAYGFHKAK